MIRALALLLRNTRKSWPPDRGWTGGFLRSLAPRLAALALLAAAALAQAAWVESVEFPWTAFPRSLWERELVWLKNIGIAHVSLPPAPPGYKNADAQLSDVIRIVRRLNIEADLEGPVPESLQAQTRAHGGPLTEPPAEKPARVSATAPDALLQSRRILTSGKPSFIWTDVEDTIGPSGYHAGAVSFNGQETAATTPVRRSSQLTHYWGQTLMSLYELPGAATRLPAPGITANQFAADGGASFVSVVNNGAKPWTGDIKAVYPLLKRLLVLPNVTVPAHDSVWLPVGVPLTAGPLCKDCTGFATVDHLIYATAELTDIEYENGILAMEFAAPSSGEAVLQVSQQPSGPLVAGGKPATFDWDDAEKRVRLPIPAGTGAAVHVRIGLAMEAPDQTAFFDSAHVLTIGETNALTAQFSSEQIAQRSRLRTVPELHTTQDAPSEALNGAAKDLVKDPLHIVYRIQVPDTAIHGDHADLSLEADGSQMSHARPQLLKPVQLRFTDAIAVRVGANSTLSLTPATVPVNQRMGRDFGISIRNNAPEIRNFTVEMKAEGLDFSPAKIDVVVGASAAREVSFRVFTAGAPAGLHRGEARISGAASAAEPVRFVVIPQTGAVAFDSDGISLLESANRRASFLPGRWLEFINKENGQNAIAAGGVTFQQGTMELRGDGLAVGGKTFRIADLEALAPKPKR